MPDYVELSDSALLFASFSGLVPASYACVGCLYLRSEGFDIRARNDVHLYQNVSSHTWDKRRLSWQNTKLFLFFVLKILSPLRVDLSYHRKHNVSIDKV